MLLPLLSHSLLFVKFAFRLESNWMELALKQWMGVEAILNAVGKGKY